MAESTRAILPMINALAAIAAIPFSVMAYHMLAMYAAMAKNGNSFLLFFLAENKIIILICLMY